MEIKANWKIDIAQLIYAQHGELESQLAKILADEIDWEIRSENLKAVGWYEVDVSERKYNDNERIEIAAWVHKNIKNPHADHQNIWMFKDEQDAVMFTLRWK
jgi:hypothetical protein